MTISSTTRKTAVFSGNDVTQIFAFTFKVLSAADVYVVESTDGVESVKTIDTDYTVSLNADQNVSPGGSITRLDPLPTGSDMIITSDQDALQPVNVQNAGGFYPSVFNNAFDRLTIGLQQIDEKMGRTVRFPITSPGNGDDLPGADERAGHYFGFDDNGDPALLDVLNVPRLLTTVETVTCGTGQTYAGPREAFAAYANVLPVGDGRVVIQCTNEVHDMGSSEFAPRHTNLERFSFTASSGVVVGTSEVEGTCVWRWDVGSSSGFRIPRGYTLGGITNIDIQCGEGAFEAPITGDGVTTVLPYTFEIADGYQLYVIKETAAGVKSVLIETTDYTLNPADFGDPTGGDVTMTAPLANDGATYTVMRAGAPGRVSGAAGFMVEGEANIDVGTRVRRWWFNYRSRDGANVKIRGTSHAEADKVAGYDGADSNLHLFGDGWYEYFESARASSLPDGNTSWGVGIVLEGGGRGRGRYTRSWGNHWAAIGGFSKGNHWGGGGEWRNSLGGPVRDGVGVVCYYAGQVDVGDAVISNNADYGIAEYDFGRVFGTPASNTGNGVAAVNQVFAFLASQELAFPHNVSFGGTHDPAAPIDVQSNASGIGVEIRALSGGAGSIQWASSDGTVEKARLAVTNGGDMVVSFGSPTTERLRLLSGGGMRAGGAGVGDIGSASLPFANARFNTGYYMGSLLVIDASAGVRFRSYTSTELAAIGNAVNTTDKAEGKVVWNTTTKKPVYATGSTAGAVWNDATGALAHTPV